MIDQKLRLFLGSSQTYFFNLSIILFFPHQMFSLASCGRHVGKSCKCLLASGQNSVKAQAWKQAYWNYSLGISACWISTLSILLNPLHYWSREMFGLIARVMRCRYIKYVAWVYEHPLMTWLSTTYDSTNNNIHNIILQVDNGWVNVVVI